MRKLQPSECLWFHHPVVRRALTPLVREGGIPKGCVGVHGKVYSVRDLLPHPGGDAFLHATEGTDVTALFETHHLNMERAMNALQTAPVRGTYEQEHAFQFDAYRRVRERMFAMYPTRRSRRMGAAWKVGMYACFLACGCMHAYVLSSFSHPSWGWASTCVACGVVNTMAGGYGHNGLHVLHPSSLALDWNGLSTFEWLLEHVSSHHVYVNTPFDHDAISMEPFVNWLPDRPVPAWFGKVGEHLIFAVAEVAVAVQGNFVHRTRWRVLVDPRFPAWVRFAPFLFALRVASCILVQGWWFGTCTCVLTLIAAGYLFSLLAHCNHRYGGDKRPDFAAHQMANTVDLLPLGPFVMFLDRQRLHHLFPCIDHTRLCRPTRP